MASWHLAFIAFIIFVALAFDFTNGLHDAANSVATVVSTRVLSPKQAVIWAAFFNFIAFLSSGRPWPTPSARASSTSRSSIPWSSSPASSAPSPGTS